MQSELIMLIITIFHYYYTTRHGSRATNTDAEIIKNDTSAVLSDANHGEVPSSLCGMDENVPLEKNQAKQPILLSISARVYRPKSGRTVFHTVTQTMTRTITKTIIRTIRLTKTVTVNVTVTKTVVPGHTTTTDSNIANRTSAS